jgi:tape measure domain-containing protein
MATVAELEVKIKADMAGVSDQVKKLKGELEKVGPPAVGASRSFNLMASAGKLFAGIGIASTLASIAKAAISGAAALEQNTVAFEVMTGSAETAKNLIIELKQQAAVTPFSQDDLINSAKLLLNFGAAVEDVTDTVETLTNIAAGDAQKLSSLTLAFSQMSSAGRLMGQDLLQMINAGFNPLREISKKTGESMSVLKKRMEEGGVSSQEVADAFKAATEEGGQFYQMNEKQSKTLIGQWSTFKSNIAEAATSFGELLTPAINAALSAFNKLAGALKEYNKKIEENSQESQTYYRTLNDDANRYIRAIESSNEVLKRREKETGDMANNIRARQRKNIEETNIRLQKTLEKLKEEGKLTAELAKYYNAPVKKTATNAPELTQAQIEAQKRYAERYKKDRETLAAINQDFTKRLIDQEGDARKKIDYEEAESLKKLGELKTISAKSKEAEKAKIEEFYRKERERAEAESYQKMAQMALQSISQVVGQLGNVFSQYAANKNSAIDNSNRRATLALQAEYEAEKLNIENSLMTQTEKNDALKALDEKRAREEKALAEKTEKAKRKVARDAFIYQQGIAVTQGIIQTSLAVMQALSSVPPPFSFVLAGIMGALGAAQTALIASQPPPALAEGGFFQGPALIGEKGREFALPLDGEEGRNAMKEVAGGILSALSDTMDRSATMSGSGGGGMGGGGNVYLDGSLVGKWIQNGTRDGRILIDSGGIV